MRSFLFLFWLIVVVVLIYLYFYQPEIFNNMMHYPGAGGPFVNTPKG